MIAYICDVCDESISKSEERYMVKVSEVNHRLKAPKTICLCGKCKRTWSERLPQLFEMETRDR